MATDPTIIVRTFDCSSGIAVDVTGRYETTAIALEFEFADDSEFDALGNNPAFDFWNDPSEDVYP